MNLIERQGLRETLLELCRTDPESVVDLVLGLMDKVEQLTEQTQRLTAPVEQLEDQLKKNSGNSSKSPSTDKAFGSKPNNRSLRRKSGKKSGGQTGRKGSTLERVAEPDETLTHSLTHSLTHRLQVCPRTGRSLAEADVVGEIRRQVFDIPEPKLRVTEHVYLLYGVPGSSQTVHHRFHAGVNAPVQYGTRLGALLIYLSDYQLIPQARISKLCLDLYGRAISADTINRFRKPCFEHLEAFEEQLKKDLAGSPVLDADETGIRICAKTEHPYTPPKRGKKQRGRIAKPAVNNLIARFEKHKSSILRFIFEQFVPFTNNQAERDLRMAKVQQKISGTFRTWAGAKRFARIRSYISTAQKRGHSVYQALHEAVLGKPLFVS